MTFSHSSFGPITTRSNIVETHSPALLAKGDFFFFFLGGGLKKEQRGGKEERKGGWNQMKERNEESEGK